MFKKCKAPSGFGNDAKVVQLTRSGDEYNVKLSLRRAETVRGELHRGGLDLERMRVVGHGESQPVADNGTEEGRAQNRRVEIVIED